MHRQLALFIPLLVTVVACAAGETPDGPSPGAGQGSGAGSAHGGGGGDGEGGGFASGGSQNVGGGMECQPCSADFTQVLDCEGNVLETCPPDQLCGLGVCMAPCDAAEANKSSVGCDYYAVTMNAMERGFGGCFVSFVANTSNQPVHIQASWGTQTIDLGAHAAIPEGSGANLSYAPYDASAGLPPGKVAILFLANDPVWHGTWGPPAPCPVPAAVGLDAHVHWGVNLSTGISKGFHITTDQPVVAYQMLPYNAASAATTGATLLLPTSAWDTNYVAVGAYRAADFQGLPIPPSTAIVAKEDNTKIDMLPRVAIPAGYDVPAGQANVPWTLTLNKGEFVEFIQTEELTGSPILADKPIAVFAGHLGLRVPWDKGWSDHAEQQIPPIKSLGFEYAVGSYRDRVEGVTENRVHRVVGAVDGTTLTFDPPISGAPSSVGLGDIVEFQTDQPFVVRSQDKEHPFLVFSYMSGSDGLAESGAPAGYGDSDFLRLVPGQQYLSRYVFFTDPTYPETNLVVIRRRTEQGFADVELDCAGVLGGWQPIGASGDYELTRVDLTRHLWEPQGGCDTGRREMWSSQPFGLYVWGWGSPETRPNESAKCVLGEPDNSCDVSYAYAAGENVIPVNTVYVPPVPR